LLAEFGSRTDFGLGSAFSLLNISLTAPGTVMVLSTTMVIFTIGMPPAQTAWEACSACRADRALTTGTIQIPQYAGELPFSRK